MIESLPSRPLADIEVEKLKQQSGGKIAPLTVKQSLPEDVEISMGPDAGAVEEKIHKEADILVVSLIYHIDIEEDKAVMLGYSEEDEEWVKVTTVDGIDDFERAEQEVHDFVTNHSDSADGGFVYSEDT